MPSSDNVNDVSWTENMTKPEGFEINLHLFWNRYTDIDLFHFSRHGATLALHTLFLPD